MLSIITNIRDEIEIYLIYIDGKYIFPLRLMFRRIKNKLNDFAIYAKRMLIHNVIYGNDTKNNMNDIDDMHKQSNLIEIKTNSYYSLIIVIQLMILFMILMYIFIF